jgi:acyl carrier protein
MNDRKANTVAGPAPAEATEIPEYLNGLWKQLLHVQQVNPDDGFFVLGGDSVLVIEMLISIQAHFDREFEFGRFFPKPSLRTLSSLIQEQLQKPA